MGIPEKVRRWGSVCLCGLLLLVLPGLMPRYGTIEVYEERQEIGGAQGADLRRAPTSAGEPYTISRVLTAQVEDACLLLRANHQVLQATLDGAPLLQSAAVPSGENPGMALYYVPLPPDYLNKTLEITIISPYEAYSGKPEAVFLGGRTALEAMNLAYSLPVFAVTVLTVVAGLAIFAFGAIPLMRGRRNMGGALFGIFCVVWGLYISSGTPAMYALFSPRALSGYTIGLYLLYPLALIFYIATQFQWYRRWLYPGTLIHSILAAVAFVLRWAGKVDFPQLLWAINGLYVLHVLALLVTGVLEYRRGNAYLRFLLPWLALAAAGSLLTLARFYLLGDDAQNDTLYLGAFFLLMMATWYYHVRQFIRRWQEDREEARALQIKNELMEDSLQKQREYNEQVRLLRHEIGHQLSTIKAYLDGGDTGKAGVYLEGLVKQGRQVDQLRYSENYLVDSLIGTQMAKAASLAIESRCDIRLPRELPVAEDALCSVLMNLLDNALEACEKVPAGKRRWLRLEMRMEPPYLYICCENSRHGEIIVRDGRYLTSKADAQNHGFGLRAVDALVRRDGGMLDIRTGADSFCAVALLREN